MNHSSHRCMTGLLALLTIPMIFALTCGADEAEWQPISRLDIVRIEELYHINDLLGDSLWPGFSSRNIPIAINNGNRQELLIGHPSPPEDFEVFEDYAVKNQTIYIRDGSTLYGPTSGGWATEVGGVLSAYVGTLWKGPTTEDYLSLIMHECFHVFQRDYRQWADGQWGELPELDEEYSALICLESAILSAILTDLTGRDIRQLAHMFVAVRQERRKELTEDIILAENEEEYSEGTATYIQARAYELLASRGGVEPLYKNADARYGGFVKADSLFTRMLASITPPPNVLITFFHAQYHIGMAECLVLDRIRPGWKEELREKGITPFHLFEREFPLDSNQRVSLMTTAKRDFAYDSIFAVQSRLVEARTDTLLAFLEASGRRYRIYYSKLESPFKWMPRGPVYQVPNSLMDQVDERLGLGLGDLDADISSNRGPIIWGGGLGKFEIDDFSFESQEVPILFRHEFFEWIDPNPAIDGSDIGLEFKVCDGDLYTDLVMTTEAFVLRAPKARIDVSDKVVAIYPMKLGDE